jgi:hypothetical protein
MQPQAQAVEQGVAVAELCRRAGPGARPGRTIISAQELEHWLIAQGFAERAGKGRVRPTRKACDLHLVLSWE